MLRQGRSLRAETTPCSVGWETPFERGCSGGCDVAGLGERANPPAARLAKAGGGRSGGALLTWVASICQAAHGAAGHGPVLDISEGIGAVGEAPSGGYSGRAALHQSPGQGCCTPVASPVVPSPFTSVEALAGCHLSHLCRTRRQGAR